MNSISLKTAKNSLISYDLICIWDISVKEGTARIVKDNLQPKLNGTYTDYAPMVDWLADSFIFSEDRKVFRANLDLNVLKSLEKDYYFSVRTQFPDGRIREFIYLLCPSSIEDDAHVLFSIFDLENDSDDIVQDKTNFVAPPKDAFKTPTITGASFKYVTVFGCLAMLFAIAGVFDLIPHVLSVILLLLCACFMYICARSVANVYAKAENDLYKRHDAAVVSAATALSRVIDTERELDRSRLVFLSCISRDVRTPLNTIVGLTTLALKKIDDRAYVEECLNKISHENNELVSLIGNIVNISEAESGRMKLNKATFPLSEIVNEVSNSVSDSILAKRQNFDVRVSGVRYEYLVGDEDKVKSVLTNLLSNAVKYTHEGGHISMDVKESYVPRNQDFVKLEFIIEDDGIGISSEYKKEMYSAFSRAIDSNIKKIKGTGLGLALCKRYVDLMDGTITCESKEGLGTKFTVAIQFPISGNDNSEMVLDPMRVLLVNDDQKTLDSIAKTIADMGGTIDGVTNYQDALEHIVEKRKYDIIICDWHNVDEEPCNGIRLLRKAVGNDTPIIITSPFAWNNIESYAENADINGFVQNPCFKSTIYIDVMRHIMHDDSSQSKHTSVENEELDLTGTNILIAEDNDLNWEILAEILETVGAKSVRAENGLVCVDKMYGAKDGEFDAVLMDIQMPILDGIAATKEIRKSKREFVSNVPIIAMTADSLGETVAACKEAGMNGFVTKPVDLNKLFVELRKIKKI